MADTDLGDLSFTLSVKSNVEEQMDKIRKGIEQTNEAIKLCDKTLHSADKDVDKKKASLSIEKLKKGITEYNSQLKSLGTRYNQILDITKKIEESSKSVHSLRKGDVGPFDPNKLRSYSKELGNLMGRIIALSKSNLGGAGFKMNLGDIKREFAQINKGISGITSGASKASTKASREAQKAVDEFEKAEDQAAKYYRTRKMRVDDAITSLSKKQANLREMMGNASKEDATAMQAAIQQADILIHRLAAAKDQYEQMQVAKANGVNGAALSSTYLGRYTGMSELFGGNFANLDQTGIAQALANFAGGGTLSYNNFNQLYKEITGLAAKHAAIQKQMDKANDEEQMKVNKTIERYAKLRSMLSEGLSVRRQSNLLGVDTTKLNEQLTVLAQKILALRSDMQTQGYANNLFKSGKNKAEINDVEEQIRLQKQLNRAKEEQGRIDEKNNNHVILNRDKRGYIQNRIEQYQGQWTELEAGGATKTKELNSLLRKFRELSDDLKKLSDEDLKNGNAVNDLLRRRHYGTMAKRIGEIFKDMRQQAREAESEAKTAKEAEDRLKSQINKMNRLSEQWEGRRAGAKSSINESWASNWKTDMGNEAVKLGGIKRSDYQSDAEFIKAANEELRNAKHLQEESATAAAKYNNEQSRAAREAAEIASNQQKAAEATKQNVSAARSLADEFGRVHNKSRELSSTMSEFKMIFLQGGGLYAAQSLVNSIVQTGGQIEQQHIALRAMIGDAQEADALFGKMKTLAIHSPFTFSEIIRDTKMMTAYGIAQKDVYETTKRLADISAGLGVSVERLALAFGQVHARGWLDAKELRQFAYAGLPLLSRLSEYYTGKEGKEVSKAEVTKRIKKRQVGFEDVKSVLWELTDKGGQFYNMQDQLTDTLLGKYNKLKDAWDIMLSDFTNGGNVVGNVFKCVLDALANIIQGMHVLSPLLASAAAFFGGKKLLGMIGGTLGFGNVQKDIFIAQRNKMQEFAASTLERTLAGEITQQEMTQLMLDRQQTYEKMKQSGSLYAMLAVSGQLKPMEIFRLMNSQKQTAQTKVQTAELAKQLQMMGILSKSQAGFLVSGNKFGFGASTVLGKIGGFLKANWFTAAFTAVGAIWSSANEFYEKNKQKGEEAASQAKNAINELNQLVDKNKNKKLSSGYIIDLQATLKESHLYTVSMDQQIARATTLAEKYKVIKKAIADAKFVQDHGDMVANALNASKYGTYNHWWEYIIGNSKNVKNGGLGTWWGNQFFDDSLEDNIKQLQEAQVAYEDLKRTGVASQDEIRKASEKVRDAWREMIYDDIPRMVNSITKDLQQTGIAWSNLASSAKHDFVVAISQVVEAAGIAGTQLGRQMFALMWLMRAHPGWVTDQKKMNHALMVYGKFYDNNFKKWTAPDKPEPEPIDDTGSKNKNKNKGSHSDRYLKARQKEASAIQSYYDAWNNWRDVEGDERARKRVANDPRFSAEFRAKYPDPSDLVANYEKLAETTKANTDERKQFVQEYKAKAVEEEGKIELENAKRLNNIFKEQLDNISKRYEIYKKLKEVAGRDVAGAYAFGNNKHSESYYAYLLSKLSNMGNVNDFVDNGLPSGSTIGGITVKAKANKVDFSKYGGLEGVMGLSDDTVLHEYGTNVANLIGALKAERDKLDQSIAETITNGYQYFNDYAVQIQAINDKYDEQIERLKERNKLNKDNLDYVSDDDLKRGTEIANQMRGRETAAVNLKQLKDSDTYRKFFGATFLLGTKEASKFADVIRNAAAAAFNSGAISAEEYASKIKEIEEQMNSISSRRSVLLSYLTGGLDSIINKHKEDAQKEIERGSYGLAKANELYQKGVATPGKAGFDMMSQAMSQQDAARKVIQNGMDMMRGANQAATAMSIIDKVVQGINSNVKSLGSLCEDIASDIETLSGTNASEDFRSSTGYTFVGAFSKASQGATDAWNSLKSGNIMGVVEGGYRSIMGWITPWAQRHDNKLQKQIEIAQRQLNAIQGLQSSIERGLSNSLGGVYGYTSNSRDTKKIREGLDNYSLAKTGAKYGHNTYGQSALIGTGIGAATGAGAGLLAAASTGALAGSIAGPLGAAIGAIGGFIGGAIGSLFGHKKKKHKTNYSDDTYRAMQHADETQAYYDQKYASYKMQRDNLNAQLRAEKDKKKSDKDKIQDYQNSIDELDDKIKTFAKDQAKALYNINVNDYASQLTDAIVSAWASGEDAAEAYKNKVTDIMRGLAKNIIANKVMAKYLEPVEDFIEKEMDKKSGKLDEESIVEIANKLQSASTDGINTVTAILEKLKDAGVDLSDNSSSSASSSIKGITENTADILASYVNAIRADVSVIRQLEGLYLPKFDVTILAQLEQQKAIAENTRVTAEAASSIRDSVITVVEILHASQTQARPLSVKVN